MLAAPGMVATLQPLRNVEVAGTVKLDGILVEQVRHQNQIAIGGDLVGDELCVQELVSHDVGEAEEVVRLELYVEYILQLEDDILANA